MVFTNKTISKCTFIKSLLTSLFQREDLYPSLAKRGEGRFSGKCGFTYELFSNYGNYLFFSSESDFYRKTFGIVIPNEVRNLVFSGKDCHVASLLAMTVLKESLNLSRK